MNYILRKYRFFCLVLSSMALLMLVNQGLLHAVHVLENHEHKVSSSSQTEIGCAHKRCKFCDLIKFHHNKIKKEEGLFRIFKSVCFLFEHTPVVKKFKVLKKRKARSPPEFYSV